jgi:hypothetical protein
MKLLLLPAALLSVAILLASSERATPQPKDKEAPKGVGEVAPHELDDVFEKGDITTNLINHPLYKKAVKAALKAKQDREQDRKKNPIGPSPARAARIKFLEVLLGEEKAERGAKPPPEK